MLALAAFARIAMAMAEVGKTPGRRTMLAWAPAGARFVAGGLFVVTASLACTRSTRRRGVGG